MEKTKITLAGFALGITLSTGLVGAASAANTSSTSMKDFHKGVACESCHGEKSPTAPTKTDCSGCHGSAEDVAKLTAGKFKKYYNPHDSLHYATYADCVLCHREHSESRLDCNNARCHSEFKYKVP